MLNQLYHEYNPNQYPWYVLFLSLSENTVDRNVSPDKQTLILEDEDSLLSDLRQVFDDLFCPYRGEFGYDNSNSKSQPLQNLIVSDKHANLKKATTTSFSLISEETESEIKLLPFRRSMSLDSPYSLKTDIAKIKEAKKTSLLRYEFTSRNLETPFFIQKTDFGSMKVIGQFNLGFILVSFHSHLFIVDQHASDEKFLFEKFSDETIIAQNLICPKKLFLTPQNQLLVGKYREQLKNQGFLVSSRNSEWTLDAVPFMKQVAFNTSDLDELIQEMASHPLVLPLCKRMKGIFASKACRTAVMIGDPLSYLDMKKIVSNMENVRQPWNCPHGRPTLRFLLKTFRVHDQNDDEPFEIY
jgi:DNA mismatch repair protein PMS2